MGAFLRSALVLFVAVALLALSPVPAAASSRHLHRHLESLDGPVEHDFFFSNISQLNPNVTANLVDGCWYKPINFTKYQTQVENLVSSFYQRLLNGTLLPAGGNVTVVRLADGTLSIIEGNVTVSPTGLLIVNGNVTTSGVYNGTLRLNQTLPNITSVITQIFQQAASLTGNNSTLGGLVNGILGNLPPVAGLNASGILPTINFSPSMLSNTTHLLTYSPVTPTEILQYLRNLTEATLASVDPGILNGADNGPLNRAPATPVATTPVPTARPGVNQSLPGFPDIKVYFFVIVARSTDNDVTQTMLVNQIARMNADYGASGFPSRFVLAGAVRIVNPQWVNRDVDTEEPVFNLMKTQTRIGGPQDLNVWITTFSDSGLNGYATFPWDYADDPHIDGIVISKYTLPMERNNPNYQALRSVGITLTHETGHWLGLFHTFQGGCAGSGDFVADTQAEGTPNDYSDPACTKMKFSCPAGNRAPPDPIFNFMDYGACRRTFTAGQVARAKQYWTYYRYNKG